MRNRSRRIGVLVSGGLDSAMVLHRLLASGARIVPLYLRCGLSWETAELHWLRRFLRAVRSPRLAPLDVIDAPLGWAYGSHWSVSGRKVPSARTSDRAVFLPGRNLLLLSYAGIVCAQRGISTIALGTLRGNPFGDATPRFFSQLASCLSQALERPIRVVAPLHRMSKTQALRAATDVPLQLTFSCLSPSGYRHCGRCNKCAERKRAFRDAGVPDPTIYAN